VTQAANVDPLEALQARLGVWLSDRALLLRALTHHSYCPDTSTSDAYDTLEFLGDALIGAQVVEHIFHAYPKANEGEMTALKSEVVSRRVLSQIGLRLGLMEAIRVDAANLRTFNDRSRESLCADVLEALVGAIHLDQGREAAAAFVAREILPIIPVVKSTLGHHNPKGALQQRVLRQTGQLPHYEVLATGGQSNDRTYTVGAYVGNRLLATGTGTSIKEAGRAAARAALDGELPASDCAHLDVADP
jgi:ribonuclease III